MVVCGIQNRHTEYAERIYAYMEKSQGDTKRRISWLLMVRHKIFLDPYFRYKTGWIMTKNHYTLLSL
jgi:hypothetical protein